MPWLKQRDVAPLGNDAVNDVQYVPTGIRYPDSVSFSVCDFRTSQRRRVWRRREQLSASRE